MNTGANTNLEKQITLIIALNKLFAVDKWQHISMFATLSVRIVDSRAKKMQNNKMQIII